MLHILCVCVCVCVALGIQHVMHIPHIVMWPARLHHIFPHYPIKGTIKKKLLNVKCVLIFSTDIVRYISHSKKN